MLVYVSWITGFAEKHVYHFKILYAVNFFPPRESTIRGIYSDCCLFFLGKRNHRKIAHRTKNGPLSIAMLD